MKKPIIQYVTWKIKPEIVSGNGSQIARTQYRPILSVRYQNGSFGAINGKLFPSVKACLSEIQKMVFDLEHKGRITPFQRLHTLRYNYDNEWEQQK